MDKRITDILYEAISKAMDVVTEQYSEDGLVAYDQRISDNIDKLIDITNLVESIYKHPQGVIVQGVCVHER